MTIHYFAYGSNMLTERLQARCSSARPIGVASLMGFTLDFSKTSQDGSGKATLVAAPEVASAIVHGVVFELNANQLPILDTFEGLGNGYDRPEGLSVSFPSASTPLPVTTYIAHPDHRDEQLQPYDWYHALVVTGARQHGLANHHLDRLTAIFPKPDPHLSRRSRLEALEILGRL
ncbi:MAG: gamma-glutamylcyclotransferase [Alphaproteobacteria bacterium]|nr:gamma-glutamylcyclotransferase [Alphaproteobacteria bacterium]